jgi:hypothetical protein
MALPIAGVRFGRPKRPSRRRRSGPRAEEEGEKHLFDVRETMADLVVPGHGQSVRCANRSTTSQPKRRRSYKPTDAAQETERCRPPGSGEEGVGYPGFADSPGANMGCPPGSEKEQPRRTKDVL